MHLNVSTRYPTYRSHGGCVLAQAPTSEALVKTARPFRTADAVLLAARPDAMCMPG